jgi:hypothetical protein
MLKALGQAFSDPCSPGVGLMAEEALFQSLDSGDEASKEAALSVLLRNRQRISGGNWYRLRDFMTDPQNASLIARARAVLPGECDEALAASPPPAKV